MAGYKGRHNPVSAPRMSLCSLRVRSVSLIELLVVIAIIALMLSMLIPSLSHARELVRRVMCSNNLRQWGVAAQYYREDYEDYLPTEGTYFNINKPGTWFNVLPHYLDVPAYKDVERDGKLIKDFPQLHVWICPSKNLSDQYKSRSGKNQFHYGMNIVLDGIGKKPNGSKLAPGFPDQAAPVKASHFMTEPYTVFMFDMYPNDPRGMQDDVGTSYHKNYANVLYVDSGVSNFKAEDFVVDGNYRKRDLIWNHPFLYWGYRPPHVEK